MPAPAIMQAAHRSLQSRPAAGGDASTHRPALVHRLWGFVPRPVGGLHRITKPVPARCKAHPQRRDVNAANFGPQQNALLTTESIELDGPFRFDIEVWHLADLTDRLSLAESLQDKVDILLADVRSQHFFSTGTGHTMMAHIQKLHPEDAYVLYCLPAMGQWEVLAVPPEDGDWQKALQTLSSVLRKCDSFYDAIGGLVGYQLKVCQLIQEAHSEHSLDSPPAEPTELKSQTFLQPPSLDLSQDQAAATAAAVKGLAVLPTTAEIIPLGGAGDRLGLQCEETGQSLPTAMLGYCGRTLLENILRDLQAREYLYWRVSGEQKTTPVAVMTSDAKGNHSRILELMQKNNWFGRGEGSFNLFCQPLVPVVSCEDGKWLVNEPFSPLLKPGGHGVIWKLMADGGVFDWLEASGRQAALVRQISNPLAGTDTTLLALAGTGHAGGHSFGFASCERAVGAAEGMNVLVEDTVDVDGTPQRRYGITNVEYTEFERLGIADEASSDDTSTSLYPANTNILYIGLKQAQEQLRKGFVKGGGAVLPGMIFNMNKKIAYKDALTRAERSVRAGRMECTMQNLADCFRTPLEEVPTNCDEDSRALDTFLVYNLRRRTTSSAKRKRKPGTTKIHQTPDGSFFDLQRNGADVLSMCGMQVPSVGSVTEYLDSGPGFVFLFNPALGPLWDVITQKIRGGTLGIRSELVLEIAEASLDNLVVTDGSSLQVVAENVTGHQGYPSEENGRQRHLEVHGDADQERRIFSDYCGRIRMRNVTVDNSGIDWSSDSNLYWAHRLTRHESCEIYLDGNAEFEATDCVLSGDLQFAVPDGHRLLVTAGPDGELMQCLEPLRHGGAPTWKWMYCTSPSEDRIELTMQERPRPAILPAHSLKQSASASSPASAESAV